MGAAPQCAAASAPHDQRRRPEQTPLYRLVRQHYETFAAEVDNASGGTVMPQFAKGEFNAYLDCGILAQANDFRMTPKLLSHRLGVRRVGNTGAAGAVQRQVRIRYRRDKINILNGQSLEDTACQC